LVARGKGRSRRTASGRQVSNLINASRRRHWQLRLQLQLKHQQFLVRCGSVAALLPHVFLLVLVASLCKHSGAFRRLFAQEFRSLTVLRILGSSSAPETTPSIVNVLVIGLHLSTRHALLPLTAPRPSLLSSAHLVSGHTSHSVLPQRSAASYLPSHCTTTLPHNALHQSTKPILDPAPSRARRNFPKLRSCLTRELVLLTPRRQTLCWKPPGHSDSIPEPCQTHDPIPGQAEGLSLGHCPCHTPPSTQCSRCCRCTTKPAGKSDLAEKNTTGTHSDALFACTHCTFFAQTTHVFLTSYASTPNATQSSRTTTSFFAFPPLCFQAFPVSSRPQPSATAAPVSFSRLIQTEFLSQTSPHCAWTTV